MEIAEFAYDYIEKYGATGAEVLVQTQHHTGKAKSNVRMTITAMLETGIVGRHGLDEELPMTQARLVVTKPFDLEVVKKEVARVRKVYKDRHLLPKAERPKLTTPVQSPVPKGTPLEAAIEAVLAVPLRDLAKLRERLNAILP